jgi:hypothetical protein
MGREPQLVLGLNEWLGLDEEESEIYSGSFISHGW